jgi:hypothetical protein
MHGYHLQTPTVRQREFLTGRCVALARAGAFSVTVSFAELCQVALTPPQIAHLTRTRSSILLPCYTSGWGADQHEFVGRTLETSVSFDPIDRSLTLGWQSMWTGA